MKILLPKPWDDNQPSQICSETNWLKRRQLMGGAIGAAVAGSSLATVARAATDPCREDRGKALQYQPVQPAARAQGFYTDEALTPCRYVTNYNNFYEFGLDKSDPARYAGDFQPEKWSVKISGEVNQPGTYALEDLVKPQALEERIYRLRCVEAWSMVIPWLGLPLATLLKRFEPTSKARYVAFKTLYDPKLMRGQRSLFSTIDWPYVEGLTLPEAMNPLSFLAVGVFGRTLPGQNGAPLRLVVPWKYGFKSIKSIVEIRLTKRRPPASWNISAPREYGFYSNVNPHVSHPRWSQREERRLPGSLFRPNVIPTRMFNGYGEQVAHLYKGMDLRKNF